MVSVRYFPEPEPALRQALGEYLEWLGKEAVQVKRLQSLLLAGGYGRGSLRGRAPPPASPRRPRPFSPKPDFEG